MGANGATKALRVVKNVERLLGIEMFTATQAIEFRRPLKSSVKLEKYIADYREAVSFVDNDKVMYTEIEKSVNFIKEYNF
jgi:histidine ammonia-lyase